MILAILRNLVILWFLVILYMIDSVGSGKFGYSVKFCDSDKSDDFAESGDSEEKNWYVW